MGHKYGLKLDVNAHIMPKKYMDALLDAGGEKFYQRASTEAQVTLWDMDRRRQLMDRYEGLMHIINMGMPPVEHVISDKQKCIELAQMGNDEMAELIYKYPDYFPAGAASLPMNSIDDALKEIDRAIRNLKFRGIKITSPAHGKPLDSPEFEPIYEKMCEYDLPILVHPLRPAGVADYAGEESSKYRINAVLGWVYETSCMMLRLTFSGIMQRFPNLKIVTHHAGGFIPYLETRIEGQYDAAEMRRHEDHRLGLSRPPIEYLKRFYHDTALYGHTPGLMCCHAFCGADKMLFGTDFPMCSELGNRYTRETINAIEGMEISDDEKEMIFDKNARRLFQLPL
ncbi:amidohydrolase family protein [Chloroflexota bacterium]